MRKKSQKQLLLMITRINHLHADEFKAISQILDSTPIINEWVLQDLTRDKMLVDTGAEGMTAEKLGRTAIIKQMEGYSYEDLAFHLLDSICYLGFCRIGIGDNGFRKPALCSNIKVISPPAWEAINRILVPYGQDKNIEKGKQSRIDHSTFF